MTKAPRMSCVLTVAKQRWSCCDEVLPWTVCRTVWGDGLPPRTAVELLRPLPGAFNGTRSNRVFFKQLKKGVFPLYFGTLRVQMFGKLDYCCFSYVICGCVGETKTTCPPPWRHVVVCCHSWFQKKRKVVPKSGELAFDQHDELMA